MVVIRSLLPIVAQQLLRSRDFILLYTLETRDFPCQYPDKENNRKGCSLLLSILFCPPLPCVPVCFVKILPNIIMKLK